MEKISNDTRLAEQEMGVSTLFLAFGFLEWYEADNSDKKAYHPSCCSQSRSSAKRCAAKKSITFHSGKGPGG